MIRKFFILWAALLSFLIAAQALAASPDAPGIGAATATSSTSATVAFTAPANNGGLAITKYTATSNPGGKTGTVN